MALQRGAVLVVFTTLKTNCAINLAQTPHVVGTITQAATLNNFRREEPRTCDVVEMRLDKIGFNATDWIAKGKAIELQGVPVIFTLRLAAEGGEWRRPDEERAGYFGLALENFAAIDVEWQSRLVKKLSQTARAAGKQVIVSYHDFVKTPSLRALQDVVIEAGRYASIVKVTTMITRPADVATLRELLKQDWSVPLCVMGMGEQGTETRVLFPTLGSCLTYGYLDESAAPGQIAAPELVRRLGELSPQYRMRPTS